MAETCARRGAGFSRFLQLVPGEGESQTTGETLRVAFLFRKVSLTSRAFAMDERSWHASFASVNMVMQDCPENREVWMFRRRAADEVQIDVKEHRPESSGGHVPLRTVICRSSFFRSRRRLAYEAAGIIKRSWYILTSFKKRRCCQFDSANRCSPVGHIWRIGQCARSQPRQTSAEHLF